jgi:hypothetical protein
MKYSIGNLEELYNSYTRIKKTSAYKDIVKFLIDEKLKAQKKLKLEESPEARATWNLVDNFFERINKIQKEVINKHLKDNK